MLLGGFLEGILLVLNNHRRKIRSAEQSWRLKDLGRTCGQKQNKVTEDRGSRWWVAGTFPDGLTGPAPPRQDPAWPCGPDTTLLLATSLVSLTPPPGCWRCLSPGHALPCGRMGASQYSGCRARLPSRAPMSCPAWLKGSGQQEFPSTWQRSSRSNLVI